MSRLVCWFLSPSHSDFHCVGVSGLLHRAHIDHARDIFSESYDHWPTAFRLLFPRCIFPMCIFAKFTQLSHLLSFVRFVSILPVLECNCPEINVKIVIIRRSDGCRRESKWGYLAEQGRSRGRKELGVIMGLGHRAVMMMIQGVWCDYLLMIWYDGNINDSSWKHHLTSLHAIST